MPHSKRIGGTLLIIIFSLITVWNLRAETTLIKVEKITPEERAAIAEAENKVAEARSNLERVKNKVADFHGFKEEEWMEWSTHVIFDGDFILQYHRNFMPKFSSFNTHGNLLPESVKREAAE